MTKRKAVSCEHCIYWLDYECLKQHSPRNYKAEGVKRVCDDYIKHIPVDPQAPKKAGFFTILFNTLFGAK